MAYWAFWSFSIHSILLISLSETATTTPSLRNETDRLALLAFKAEITDDPLQALSSWKNDSLHFCEWRGITCGSKHQRVRILNLTSLSLEGPLSPHIANLSFLSSIDLSNNGFHGRVPHELGHLFRLRRLNLSSNSFQGEIPAAISNCSKLLVVDISSNNLVGKIPPELGSLPDLKVLYLYLNGLTGNIPPSLGNLSSLLGISLARNELDGSIPDDLGRIAKLLILQISQNKLSVCLVFSPCLCAVPYGRRKTRSVEGLHTSISYSDLCKATDDFSPSNLIGVGSYGSVYRGTFASDNTTVAVKVLNLQRQGASKSFIAECEALRNVRHRNLVKVLTSCSSIDFKGNDFKALIYEFMPNGSLEEWLHPKEEEGHQLRNLSLSQRLNIAIDVANALDYLHYHHGIPIVHCDIKPTNVLLDDDMVAHVGDFGLAKILLETSNNFSSTDISSIAIKGSIGYVAPEYGMGGDVSTFGDVYSYGILLLELFTGRRPTEEMFKNGLTLHEFSKMAFSDRVMEIADPLLVEENDQDDACNNVESTRGKGQRVVECFASVVRIGIACSMETPRDRMQMKEVVSEMLVIRDKFLRIGIYQEG